MIALVKQRADGDCGTAALATFLSARHKYEDVFVEAAKVDPAARGRAGLYNHELVALARRLGERLAPTRRFDLDVDEGLLRVRSEAHHAAGHWVAVRYGLVWDPNDDYVQPWRDFQTRHGARFATLLRAV